MIGIREIKRLLEKEEIQHEIIGDCNIQVDSYSSLNSVTEHKITWVKKWNVEIEERLNRVKNLIIICNEKDEVHAGKNCCVLCKDPKMCFFEILGEFYVERNEKAQISAAAVVETSEIGEGSSVGAFSYIGKEVVVGKNVEIGNNVTVIGKVVIGDHSILGHGSVLGKSGYGYYLATDGHMKKVPHLGGIKVGNYVEIGANTCIDCGTIGDTVVGDYTKIDNLCHIGHNVQIGKEVMIVAGTAICGSCEIGDGSYIAPGAVIKNQTHVGKNAFVGMQTVVIRDIKEEESVFGVPGRPFKRDYNV